MSLQAKLAHAGMCCQCQAHLDLSSAHVEEACAHLQLQVERARTGTRLRISVSLLSTWEPFTKESAKNIEMRVREKAWAPERVWVWVWVRPGFWGSPPALK